MEFNLNDPSVEALDKCTRKELFSIAKNLEIEVSNSALKKTIRDLIVIHLVNEDLLSEDNLDSIEPHNDSNAELQIKLKQLELEAQKEKELK